MKYNGSNIEELSAYKVLSKNDKSTIKSLREEVKKKTDDNRTMLNEFFDAFFVSRILDAMSTAPNYKFVEKIPSETIKPTYSFNDKDKELFFKFYDYRKNNPFMKAILINTTENTDLLHRPFGYLNDKSVGYLGVLYKTYSKTVGIQNEAEVYDMLSTTINGILAWYLRINKDPREGFIFKTNLYFLTNIKPIDILHKKYAALHITPWSNSEDNPEDMQKNKLDIRKLAFDYIRRYGMKISLLNEYIYYNTDDIDKLQTYTLSEFIAKIKTANTDELKAMKQADKTYDEFLNKVQTDIYNYESSYIGFNNDDEFIKCVSDIYAKKGENYICRLKRLQKNLLNADVSQNLSDKAHDSITEENGVFSILIHCVKVDFVYAINTILDKEIRKLKKNNF